MKSEHDQPISFNGSFGASDANPQEFLVNPWYAAPQSGIQLQGVNLAISQKPQGFQYPVLGPYMMAQSTIYGRPVAQDSANMSNQQIQSHYVPGMAGPSTPGPSPLNHDGPGFYYRNSPAPSYGAQHAPSVHAAMSYNSPGIMTFPIDSTGMREGHGSLTSALFRNDYTTSLDSVTSNSFPPAPPASGQSAPKEFIFVAHVGLTPSETSSFASDSGTASQQRPPKANKKKGFGTAIGRRPRKPHLEVVTEPTLQAAPKLERNPPRTASPKRARKGTDASEAGSRMTIVTTPDSLLTMSPGTISKARIGQRSRASTHASQQNSAISDVGGQMIQDSQGSRQGHPDDLIYLNLRLQERVDELEGEVQHLKEQLKDEKAIFSRQFTELTKTVVDIKCKVLEGISSVDALRDRSPRADSGSFGKQMAAQMDMRRPSASSIVSSSTAISSSRNFPAETAYSSQDPGWGYNRPKGLVQNEAGEHLIYSSAYHARR